jgi:hypothetical protein
MKDFWLCDLCVCKAVLTQSLCVFEKVKSQKSKIQPPALLCHSNFANGKNGHLERNFGLLLGGMVKTADTQFMVIICNLSPTLLCCTCSICVLDTVLEKVPVV